ncbi:MAG TPA: UPF0182 family protein, partial [Candidatus Eremiobacteraeota bacterium]|nr:UPF0182 family protein [Candidatus Eremiobacteraeota bacterium]
TFLQYLYSWLILTFAIIFIFITSTYILCKIIRFSTNNMIIMSNKVRIHISILASILCVLKAWGLYLARYNLLYSSKGNVYGAGYTDVTIILPVLTIMAFIALAGGIIFLINIYTKSWKLPGYIIILYLIISIVGGFIYPAIIQQFVVLPNEIGKEREYIKRNIEYTLKAYGLNRINEKEFQANEELTAKSIYNNKLTIENIRLWDIKPLIESYRQLQEIKPYYNFIDVDVDRYIIDGNYRQVMLSAREIDYNQLSTNEWINHHITYTHGYGLCLSPANRISKEGLPEFFIKDIPPVFTTDLKIDRPEIYYGEITNNYSIVKTKPSESGSSEQEFDYPSGTMNKYCIYQGTGGIPISSLFRKIIFAKYLNSLKILLNKDIISESRIMIYRNIHDRLNKAFPLLIYSNDPYMIICEGKLLWICDAYTISGKYPYSTPYKFLNTHHVNYLRNSVKVVINTYNGNIDFYISDPEDPIIKTYSAIFPGVFKDIGMMPLNIRAHIRYPEELFTMQSKVYCIYHMKDTQVFYNKEDLWDVPYGISDNREQEMSPYYTIMSIPGEKKEEFLLMIPFTPIKKDNLSAWMCARCDGEHYGDIILFRFPKKKMVYGPRQIEARINQDTEISKQLSLWNQEGSNVIRGNLLVIPIENSLIYVEPLYLKAEKGELPELKKVILVYGSQIAMEDNLEEGINKIFGDVRTSRMADSTENKSIEYMAREALNHYEKAQKYIKEGNWAKYGEELEKMKNILTRMIEGEKNEKQ